jgi:hypothetical protein
MPTSGPTPILATARLSLTMIAQGFTHHMRLRCNTAGFVGGTWLIAQSSGSTIAVQDAADMVFALLGPLYKSTQASFPGWQLDAYASGAYNPLATGATAVVPSDTSVGQIAQQATFTFRDDNFKKVRLIMLEGRVTPAAKYSYAELGGAYLDLVNSILDESDAGIGSWFCGRGDAPVNTLSFLSLVTSYNKSLRRKRGLS